MWTIVLTGSVAAIVAAAVFTGASGTSRVSKRAAVLMGVVGAVVVAAGFAYAFSDLPR